MDKNHEDNDVQQSEEPTLESESIEHEDTEVEEEPSAVDDSPPNSTTSSWDRMSSESLEDKLESSETDETAKDGHLPEANAAEAHESESKEESQLLPSVPIEDSSVSETEADNVKEVDEPEAVVETKEVKAADE